jgi:hypothetical protein
MSAYFDGPCSPLFTSLPFRGNTTLADLPVQSVSSEMAEAAGQAPRGSLVSWGIPFEIDQVVVLTNQAVSVAIEPILARWLVFLHTSDLRPDQPGPGGFISPTRGRGKLAEHAADYLVRYADGEEALLPIYRRHQVGTFQRHWGENCFQAVAHRKPHPVRAHHEQSNPDWGWSQTRAASADFAPWINWLWAWQNPYPEKPIVGFRFEQVCGNLVISGVSAGQVEAQPLRWMSRRKALLRLPSGTGFRPVLDERGLLEQVQLDLGQVISATPRPVYPSVDWESTYNNQVPAISDTEVLVEYTAHPQACFHLAGGQLVPLSDLASEAPVSSENAYGLQPVPPATQRVTLRVIDRRSGQPVAVKLHLHGEHGEYLAPLDRHRIVNPAWFEDYSVDFTNRGQHACTYIPGETTLDLPGGKVYLEVSKGFEIRPLRRVLEITPQTQEIQVEVEKVLPWREQGWVTADTHVHFLSPGSALLEGSAEGVNVINLLASQWGELMTNVGDFDGATTWGSRDAGGSGEYLVRVGTENRQHVLGHISLLGYRGPIIAPMTTGGPDESALGDPVEILLTEWARQCKQQDGLVILPHFPNPRAEHAAALVSGDVDAVEMTSWGELYAGIDPYSLSDWYRYLNCGYLVAAVGGTDKMSADTAVGTVRTYAHLSPGELFTYDSWKSAVRRAETFVTYGPLLDFAVEGQPAGTHIHLPSSGGTLEITWRVASVTVPMTRLDLIVNGEIRESAAIDPQEAAGSWSVRMGQSAWLALLVRGQYPEKPEIIAAHSSPVMVDVDGSPLLAAADAVTILEQIEGALAYLDVIGTRAEERAYKRMRLVLASAHRSLHNRLHQQGYYHAHPVLADYTI